MAVVASDRANRGAERTESATPDGWTFAHSADMDWMTLREGLHIKPLGASGAKTFAMFKFDPGFDGEVHQHADWEFTYVLEGEIVSNGVTMVAGSSYVAEPGTTHEEFRSLGGCTVVSASNT